ncbi:substrate-binding domain-containing protein [Tepidibacillus sp. HK-1]|uniref:substrate-binding domain-containing protein n=1 Tax=Tepidibacillus sp. HK-1 TaxID=1883407 RepID=UPI000853BA29|nr:substrate-binding domain-containing protein [Tepidibacillus sp. HK-1]GBF10363.1 D-allose-binding periplasmic protein precursor [Tepidibacillus sp. HK-1]
MEKGSRFTYKLKKYINIILLILIVTISFIFYKIQTYEQIEVLQKPKYHFFVILQSSVDPFWEEIRLGIEKAAKQNNVAVEFNSPRFNNPEEELKYLDIAVASHVDGIITHVSPNANFKDVIDKAYLKNIPVVTVENDDVNSSRNAFVGTNSFLLGKEAGNLMVQATAGKAKIAIIMNNDYELDEVSQNLKINGFFSTIRDYKEMEVIKIFSSRLGILSAEEITQSILKDYPQVNAIYTTNSVDTLGSAQVIVDSNKVGVVTLVGYGDTENILRYIGKSIIYGTVMSDPYKMGYESIEALIDIKEKKTTSTFIDTGVKVITMKNLQDYQNIRYSKVE